MLCSFIIVSVKTNTEHADLQNSVDMYKTVEVHVVLDGRNHVLDAFPLLLFSPLLEGRVKVMVFFNVPDVRFTHSIYDQSACMEHGHNIKSYPHEVHATISNQLSEVNVCRKRHTHYYTTFTCKYKPMRYAYSTYKCVHL